MMDVREPRYQWGQCVAAQIDLVNDGSYPDQPPDALLAAAGTVGEIVQIGHHTEAKLPVYLVDFGGRVIGCLEEEIAPASLRERPAAAAAA